MKLHNLTKFVASSRLDDAPWGDFPAVTVTPNPAVTIRELKEEDGKDLWLWGSLTLMHHLLDADAVDEVRMLVCPVSRGKGTRIFEARRDLNLPETTGFEKGVVLLRYGIRNQAQVRTFGSNRTGGHPAEDFNASFADGSRRPSAGTGNAQRARQRHPAGNEERGRRVARETRIGSSPRVTASNLKVQLSVQLASWVERRSATRA